MKSQLYRKTKPPAERPGVLLLGTLYLLWILLALLIPIWFLICHKFRENMRPFIVSRVAIGFVEFLASHQRQYDKAIKKHSLDRSSIKRLF